MLNTLYHDLFTLTINSFIYSIKYNSGASNLGELQNLLISKVMIRRLKKDVLKQLPPKQRQRIPFDVKESDLKKVDSLFVFLSV